MTTAQIDEDIATLEAIKKSLQDENEQLSQEAVRVKEEIEAETAADMAIIDSTSKELEGLEEEAEAEENQGQISEVKEKIEEL